MHLSASMGAVLWVSQCCGFSVPQNGVGYSRAMLLTCHPTLLPRQVQGSQKKITVLVPTLSLTWEPLHWARILSEWHCVSYSSSQTRASSFIVSRSTPRRGRPDVNHSGVHGVFFWGGGVGHSLLAQDTEQTGTCPESAWASKQRQDVTWQLRPRQCLSCC